MDTQTPATHPIDRLLVLPPELREYNFTMAVYEPEIPRALALPASYYRSRHVHNQSIRQSIIGLIDA